MTLSLELETEFDVDFDYKKVAEEVVEYALDYRECPYEAQVNLLITNNEEIRHINKEYRDIDRDTDVLSFPMIEYEEPGSFDSIDESGDFFDPDSGELVLGDIIICAGKVFDQAEEYGRRCLDDPSADARQVNASLFPLAGDLHRQFHMFHEY